MPNGEPIPIFGANLYWDQEQALEAIFRFNANGQNLAGEVMAKRIFAHAGPTGAPSLVVAVNALMGAQASQRDQALIAESLECHWDRIVGGLAALPADVVDNDPDALCELSEGLLPLLVNVEGQDARTYVLATKLLHWLSQGRAPIVDGWSRTKALGLQQAWDGELVEGTRILPDWRNDGTGMGANDYARWIRFYSALANGLGFTEKQGLLQHDWRTQGHARERWRARNTLVRIIDKYLWWRPPNPAQNGA